MRSLTELVAAAGLATALVACGGPPLPQIAFEGAAPFDEQLTHQGPEALIDGCPAREPSPPALTREQQAAFAWFDGLGLPDFGCRKLVRVATGQWQQVGNHPKENTFRTGFLLGDDGREFTVLTLDLFPLTFERTGDDKPEHERVGYEELDLAAAGEEYLDLLVRLDKGEDDDLPDPSWRRFGERLAERSELFVLARACAAAGHVDLAHRLLDHAAKMPERHTGQPPEGSLRETIADEIAHAMTWRAVVEFEDVTISRGRLLEKFEWLAARFPNNEHRERVEQTIDTLRRMVAEDAAHPARDLDRLEGDALIAELVFRLRDQNGHQWSQPGWCDVFADERGVESPAHRLVQIGYPAVPALIEALTDARLSRSVGYHRDFYFSHTVLTVGDVALAVVERIAGRSFYVPATTSSQMHKDDQVFAVKDEVERWWSAFQKKGEQGLLAEAAAAGDDNSPSQARLLVERFPKGALEHVIAGARAAESPWVREELVRVIGEVEGDGPLAFLEAELDRGPVLGARVAAAAALVRRGRDQAIDTVICIWRELDAGDPESYDDREKLIGFLAACGEARAIEALGRGIDELPVDARLGVVSAMGESGSFLAFSYGLGSGLDPGEGGHRSPEVEAAIEELLVGRLEDREEREGMSGTWDGKSFADPRICDIAGHVLNQLWPDRYDFDLGASLTERERRRVAAQNVWRASQGLAPLPAPARPEPLAQLDPQDALHVREARVEPAGRAAALEQRVARLVGKPLGDAAIVDLLLWVAGHLPRGASGIRLLVDRPGDLTGAVVVVRLLDARVEQEGSPGWHTNTLVSAGDDVLLSSSGTSSREYVLERESWSDLARALRRAFDSGPEAELRIRQTLVLEK